MTKQKYEDLFKEDLFKEIEELLSSENLIDEDEITVEQQKRDPRVVCCSYCGCIVSGTWAEYGQPICSDCLDDWME